ncbi:MAG: hypothetical protein V7739_09050 [Motiliproteus sp.]
MATPQYSINQFEATRHFQHRESQRGVRHRDLDLILNYGEEVDEGFVMSRNAIKQARKDLAKLGDHQTIQRLDHIKDLAVIEQNGSLVTIYRADSKRIGLLRKGKRLSYSKTVIH